ncbi:response regulator transcription factor [Pedobacter hiemivivus]|uniref:Response regulator transcription factor n=1 Tax=Pedobacter hiemivivus TaxID=2530454 RepID=A0A4U1G5Q4_9SPHI|nr:LytTR family DNA-binding domain-containing protein [Pedobacter hiemivivus]TCC97106.1 response regulator transcription factor [Pedobacter hiemivivus]TKC59081.1 response regulator transcription factor [Pedobacter hiemivivus]
MNCILIDDERPALDLLEDNIKQIPYLNIVASCRKPMAALEILKTQKVDLMFLDIQMPGINGLDLLRSISNPPMVILVTAYGEHALDGFNLDVVDYLVKPVPFSRLLKAVQKAHDLFQLRQPTGRLSVQENDHFFVNANYSLVKIRIQDIMFIEGMKDYVRINVEGGKPVITRMGLRNIEERLGTERFMRVHKSYIIALDKIESVQKLQLVVAGIEIPIGEAYRNSLQTYIADKNL